MFMNTYFSENGYVGRGYIMKKKSVNLYAMNRMRVKGV